MDRGIDTVLGRPGTRPGDETTRWSGAGTWFEAPTRFGPLRLCAAVGAPRHAADAALTLQRCATLLDALDDWSGLELAWRWVGSAAATRVAGRADACAWWNAGDPDATLGDASAHEPACLIVWPWALLRALPAPAAALAAQLQWPDVPVVLSIARLRLGNDELRLLEPGGAVLLPPSLLPPWHGTLRTAAEPTVDGCSVAVALAWPGPPRLVTARVATNGGTAGAGAADGSLCEVRLATPHVLPGDQLTGWFERELCEAGTHASLWRCAGAGAPAECLASGRLMPWGDGCALALESLHAAEPVNA